MRDAKKLTVAVLALVAAAALAACGGGDESTTGSSGDEGAAVTGKFVTLAEEPAGDFQITGEAELERTDGGTVVSLSVSGLEPKTQYIAHLHTGGCNQADPGGPHFQFEKGGSEEPPNEIHLRFTSDAKGNGEATASSKREVPIGEAGAVVLHVDDSHGHPEDQPQHAHSDKIACAELEGAAAAEGGSQSPGGDVPTVVVRNGEPVGGLQEFEYSAGDEIRFRISSDKAEEIHIHGYDISRDVPAGGTVEFDFPAELEGIYEVELEELGVQIVELRVNP
ncbi:MAG TPA: hypothetical protein VFT79_11890 [Solirubrobacterales bacterium]|nr:hypothetical protein [Solirubrobacterales bacterium]